MQRYDYLLYSLIFFGILLAILWRRPDLRIMSLSAIIWGAIGGPIIEFIYFSDYWRPDTLLGRGHVSIEDVIFGASIAALAFVLYPFVAHRGLSESKLSSRQQLIRILAYGGVGIAMFIGLYGVLHVNSVLVTIIFFVGAWLSIGWQRRDLLLPGLVVGSIFLAAAAILYGVAFTLIGTSQLHTSWLLFGKSYGWLLFGRIPVSELVWFFATGSFLSIFDLYTSGKVYRKATPSHSGKGLAPKS